jgi:hypothetical protein
LFENIFATLIADAVPYFDDVDVSRCKSFVISVLHLNLETVRLVLDETFMLLYAAWCYKNVFTVWPYHVFRMMSCESIRFVGVYRQLCSGDTYYKEFSIVRYGLQMGR